MTPESGPDTEAGPSPKQRAAEHAVRLIEPGMRVGLGTGSTAAFFVAALGRRVAAGLDIVGVPTSEATRRQAEGLGIRLATLDEEPELDITVDGADEVDTQFRLIKGGGGALLREKLVATASRRMVVIADESKRVETLGRFPLPVEIVAFGAAATARRIADLLDPGIRIEPRRRPEGPRFVTDGHNLVLDLHMGSIADPDALAARLKGVTGVVEHGLFVGLASDVLIGRDRDVMEMPRQGLSPSRS